MTTHCIKNRKGHVLVDIEAWRDENRIQDLSVAVNIQEYSIFLLLDTEYSPFDIICSFDDIQELRGKFFEANHNKTVQEFVKDECISLCNKYNLCYSED